MPSSNDSIDAELAGTGGARLYLPEANADRRRPIEDLTLHLHGSHEAARAAFTRSQRRGALVSLTLPGLSAVYAKHFASDSAGVFFQLLDTAARALSLSPARGFQSVWVSSFSAGYGGVRELLKSPDVYRRIDAVILADSLYAGFAPGQKAREGFRPPPDPANLRDFARFARDAAGGRGDKAMLLTYSALIPPAYSSTGETTRALMQSVNTDPEPRNEDWPHNLTLTEQARRGRFAALGFAGDDGPAHMRHLHGLWMFYRLVPRA